MFRQQVQCASLLAVAKYITVINLHNRLSAERPSMGVRRRVQNGHLPPWKLSLRTTIF